MQCSEMQENLSAYLDGELDPGEEAALKSHLEGCESCRKEFESLRSTVELVRSVPRVQAPAVLKQRLTSAAPSRRAAWRFPNPVALASAAALVLVAVVAVFMLSMSRRGGSGDLAVGRNDGEVGHVSDEVASDALARKAIGGRRLERMTKAEKEATEEDAAHAGKDSGQKADESNKWGRLATDAAASEKAVERRASSNVFGDSESEEGYERQKERLRVHEKSAEAVEPLVPGETPAPPHAAPPSQKAQELIPETQELADRSEAAPREVVIETDDPVGTAAQVNRILSPHVGKKGIVTGAMLEELARETGETKRGGQDTIEIVVYVDNSKSGEVLAQLRDLRAQARGGRGRKFPVEPAREEREESELKRSAGELRRGLQEKQEVPQERTKPTGGGALSKKDKEEDKAESPAKVTSKKKTDSAKSLGGFKDSPEENVRKSEEAGANDDKAKHKKKPQAEKVAIVIRILKASSNPAEPEVLKERAKPEPAAKGK
jgi:hypothetical protein